MTFDFSTKTRSHKDFPEETLENQSNESIHPSIQNPKTINERTCHVILGADSWTPEKFFHQCLQEWQHANFARAVGGPNVGVGRLRDNWTISCCEKQSLSRTAHATGRRTSERSV